jgi:hypothetical protein
MQMLAGRTDMRRSAELDAPTMNQQEAGHPCNHQKALLQLLRYHVIGMSAEP